MAEVRWRPQALRDLEAAEEYYKAVAPVFVAGAFEKAGKLGDFPRMGRPVPEIGEESIREGQYRQHRIIDVVEDDAVEVLTVFHSSRQFGKLG